jgi:hypothetical protein
MRKFSQVITISVLMTYPQYCRAEESCAYLTHALKDKMEEYRGFKARNLMQQEKLRKREEACKSSGADVSVRAAKISEGLSCQAQNDASKLNAEINTLGSQCKENFSEIKNTQEALQREFEVVNSDIKMTVKFMHEKAVLKRNCSEDIKVTETMAEAFLLLEGGIASVKSQAVVGEGEYGKLSKVAADLAKQTEALNKKCGEQDSVAEEDEASKKITGGKVGIGSAVPSEKFKQGSSDISGTKTAIDDEKKSDEAIRKQK